MNEKQFAINEAVPVTDEAAQAKIHEFEQRHRWGIVPALVWIATRDIELAATIDGESDDFETAGVHLALVKAINNGRGAQENWPLDNIDNAWTHHLVPKLAAGQLTAFATKVTGGKTSGVENGLPGVVFPPSDQPGASFEFNVVDRPLGPALIHKDHVFHHHWTEFRDPTFSRADILLHWPDLTPQSTNVASESALVNETEHSIPAPKTKVADETLVKWFVDRVHRWPKDLAFPTEKNDLDKARVDFPDNKIIRDDFREIRKNNTPWEWRRQGGRRKRSG